MPPGSVALPQKYIVEASLPGELVLIWASGARLITSMVLRTRDDVVCVCNSLTRMAMVKLPSSS